MMREPSQQPRRPDGARERAPEPTTTERRWHAITWLVWAVAAAWSIQLAPNPLDVLVVIAIAWLVVTVHGGHGPFARAFPVLVWLAVGFGLMRVVLTAATTHASEHILFTTPSFTLPEVLGGFTVGGDVNSTILLQAVAESLVVVGIIAVFGAFNAVVSHYELVQLAPRAFHELGLVVVVALAFVPSTITAVHDVGEADRARTGGRVVRRGRLLRRMVPVLESGLERAVTLSESLDSRGFGYGGATVRERGAGWVGTVSLLALGGGFVALVARENTLAIVLGIAGAVGLFAAVRIAAGGARRVAYRRRRMTPADWWCSGASALAPMALAALSIAGDDTLVWTVSPLRWPSLGLLPLLALGALLAPVLLPPPLPARPRRPATLAAPTDDLLAGSTS
jgi:energy-coupling factor transport system permease protein